MGQNAMLQLIGQLHRKSRDLLNLLMHHLIPNGNMTQQLARIRIIIGRKGRELPHLADIMAQSDYCRREKLERLEKWRELYGEILAGRQCVSLKTLAVKGSDLIALGWKPGKELGAVLQKLLELVLDDPGRNTREILLAQAEQMKIAGES